MNLNAMERIAADLSELAANDTFVRDMAKEERLPLRVKDSLLRSREYAIIGGGPKFAFGPFWQMYDSFDTASETAVVGTSEVSLWTLAKRTSFPANFLRAGQKWFVHAFGIITTPGSSQGNITLTPRFGTSVSGTSLGASAATALAASATNVAWNIDYYFTVRRNEGTSSTAIGNGELKAAVGMIAASTGNLVVFGSTGSVTIDTSVAAGLVMGVTLGSASDSMQAMDVILASLN